MRHLTDEEMPHGWADSMALEMARAVFLTAEPSPMQVEAVERGLAAQRDMIAERKPA